VGCFKKKTVGKLIYRGEKGCSAGKGIFSPRKKKPEAAKGSVGRKQQKYF